MTSAEYSAQSGVGYIWKGFFNMRPVFFKNPITFDRLVASLLSGLTSTIKAV